MRHEVWSAERYRQEMGLPNGVAVPASSKVRKSILELTKPEREYAHFLEYEKLAGRVVAYWPQPFALRLPGWRQTYRPDFLIQYAAKGFASRDDLEIVEIKVQWSNRKVGWKDDARVKLKTAAGIYACFAWVARWKDEHGCWEEERF